MYYTYLLYSTCCLELPNFLTKITYCMLEILLIIHKMFDKKSRYFTKKHAAKKENQNIVKERYMPVCLTFCLRITYCMLKNFVNNAQNV